MPTGMSHSDLLEMLSRLTVHVDEELRSRAFSALQSFAIDFPTLREEVVATFLSFVLKQVSVLIIYNSISNLKLFFNSCDV